MDIFTSRSTQQYRTYSPVLTTIRMMMNSSIRTLLSRIPALLYFARGRAMMQHAEYSRVQALTARETAKSPSRTHILNYLLSLFGRETWYLEIGTRNPEHNFRHIRAHKKFSVDPGVEFSANPVDFPMTSDEFFYRLEHHALLPSDTRFDVIFIDGLHVAEQVDRDIENALRWIRDDGFIVLHDCNPPAEWHARENYTYSHTPARGMWNGTTWKAFYRRRLQKNLYSCCIDTDWGVGVIQKTHNIGAPAENKNPFFEFQVLDAHRAQHLNLVSFEEFATRIEKCLASR